MHATVMNAAFTPTRMRISIERYQKMVERGVLTKDDRVELIEGEMIDMAPIGTKHFALTARINQFFTLSLKDRAIVSPGGPVNLGKYSEPQPDITLLKPRKDFYSTNIPEAADVLLLIEVSDSSLAFDLDTKLKLYARYGIVEYWIVDVQAKRVIVHRQPKGETYADMREFSAPTVIAPLNFPHLEVPIAEFLP